MTVDLTKSDIASTIADNSIVLVDFWADIVHAKVDTEAVKDLDMDSVRAELAAHDAGAARA